MKTGPRYKIARRLGADIFEKTQSPKYALRSGKDGKFGSKGFSSRSNFGIQLKEKQRARKLYGVGERQFARYVADAISKKTSRDDEALFVTLESRVDNVLFRLGFAPSRQASRQLASHGHIQVNGKRITIPSYGVSVGDVITIRPGSQNKGHLAGMADRVRDKITPAWLRYDLVKGVATVVGSPKLVKTELPFDISAILEYYRR